MDKENTDIKVECGSHNRIIIDKLFGPACVPNLIITWEGDDWNVRKVNSRLRKELKKAKTQTINEIIELIEKSIKEDRIYSKQQIKDFKEGIEWTLEKIIKEIKELGK